MEEFQAEPKPTEANPAKDEKIELRTRFLTSLWRRMGWFMPNSPESEKPEVDEEDEDSPEIKPVPRVRKGLKWAIDKLVSRRPVSEAKSTETEDLPPEPHETEAITESTPLNLETETAPELPVEASKEPEVPEAVLEVEELTTA